MLPYQMSLSRNIRDLDDRVTRLETLESAGARGGGGFELIEEIVLDNNVTSLVQFADIPQTYQHLWLLISARVYDSDVLAPLWMTFNGDTGALKYEWMYRYLAVIIADFAYDNHLEVGRITGQPNGETSLVDSFTTITLCFPHYHISSPSDPGGKWKTVSYHGGGYADSDEDEEAAFWMDFKGSGIYRDTDAVVSIEFRPANGVFYNFESGSKFSLYGTGRAS